MPVRVDNIVQLASNRTLAQALEQANRPLAGIWACAASPITAEVCASSGVDFVIIDGEHAPNGMSSLLGQLHAVNAYSSAIIVRVPFNDECMIKQYLDLGVRNLLVPMVHTPAEAEQAAARVAYPSQGVRGVGSALTRGAGWNRVPNYLHEARSFINLITQVESAKAVDNVEAILAVDGIDSIFVGPADLAADMGMIGQAEHPDVIAAVKHCIAAANAAGKPIGVNSFNRVLAREYMEAGADYVPVDSDVTILARASSQIMAEMA